MSEEKGDKRAPANVYELLDGLAKQQAQQQQQLELLAKALASLSDKVGAQPQQGSGGGFADLINALRGLGGEGKGQAMPVKQLAELARNFAQMSDAMSHYRNPVLPYSPADKFLMKEGARRIYELRYYGVKNREQAGAESPSDEQLERELGFAEETNQEKKEEKKHEF